ALAAAGGGAGWFFLAGPGKALLNPVNKQQVRELIAIGRYPDAIALTAEASERAAKQPAPVAQEAGR
ncbi:MAG: hypothetical protein NTY02_10755, partial [Acidobacteria bacterium]|nr:hypothetical protein [Acidobacteriota bacterium]